MSNCIVSTCFILRKCVDFLLLEVFKCIENLGFGYWQRLCWHHYILGCKHIFQLYRDVSCLVGFVLQWGQITCNNRKSGGAHPDPSDRFRVLGWCGSVKHFAFLHRKFFQSYFSPEYLNEDGGEFSEEKKSDKLCD